MVDAIDLLQCPICGTFYKPEITPTGRTLSHCRLPADQVVMTVQWYDGEVEIDFSAIEARIIERYRLTEGVVGPPLTGSLLDIEV
jgi:hypothetical protein